MLSCKLPLAESYLCSHLPSYNLHLLGTVGLGYSSIGGIIQDLLHRTKYVSLVSGALEASEWCKGLVAAAIAEPSWWLSLTWCF